MRRTGAGLAAGLLLGAIAVPTGACAVPRIVLSWNRCEPVEPARPILAADRTAHLLVSVEELAGEVTGLEIQIRIRPDFAFHTACGVDGTQVTPEWSFEPGGCQGSDRVRSMLGPPDSGCPTLARQPSFTSLTVTRDSAFCANMCCGTSWETLSLQAAATQPWILVAQSRTSLWKVDFDLSASCAFAPTGSECCPGGSAMRLVGTGTAWFKDGSNADLGRSDVTYSADAVLSRPASWGELKARYR